ncbi:MAG: TolC family protein, partial [Muribaculaceae bacterium]|nr:TolC family protein [Muribaculaceae bacterium]
MRGLGKVQYKIGADISQTIWDGGVSQARRELARTQDDVRTSALDVDLYTVKQRVQNLYFAILLIDEQIAQQEVTRDLLMSNLDKLRSMLKNGVAMQSDVDMVEAQVLTVGQTITQAKSSSSGYRKTLGLFIDENLEGESLTKPEATLPESLESSRPELKLCDSQILANMVTDRLSKT